MEIKLHEIPIQDIVLYSKHNMECQGFIDKDEKGVYGMEGRLNIRPIYQREFIYNTPERDAVINTIIHKLPLNVFYWIENKDGTYEVLDGQQRLISIGQYVSNYFLVKWPRSEALGFNNLTNDRQNQILDYKLMVYFCYGTDSERLDWFRTINIAGKKLTDQELKNAIFAGSWTVDAKRHFSKTNGPAYQIAKKYLKGKAIRQEYLETAIKWISKNNIQDYMAKHQSDNNAKELWIYFNNVIEWIKKLFPKYRREMEGIPFGYLYNDYKDNEYDPEKLEEIVDKLMQDEDVTKKPGIYMYIFSGDKRYLNIRKFSEAQKRETYEQQHKQCVFCKKCFELEKMEADHIMPWSKGGKTIPDNCQLLCSDCNRTKGAK
jgi:hypothetical protein